MAIGTQQRAVTVLQYSVNGTGLGHLTRLMAIGKWLRILLNGLDLEARIFFLSCSDADFLLARQGFASFKLPSLSALKAAALQPDRVRGLIRDYAIGALEQIGPDIVVVDTFPTGTYDELLPILGDTSVTKIFIFREQRPEFVATKPYDRLLAGFDLVIVPHREVAKKLPFDLPDGVRAAWSGPIVFGEPEELWTKQEVRKTLGIPRNRTVVYTAAGGGGDGDLQQSFQMMLDVVGRFDKVHLVVGAGPLNPNPPLRHKNTSWTTFYPISRMFKGFDFAISSSGYNSVHEFLYFGVPAILYAQERTADDQLGRALKMARAGAAIALDTFTPRKLRAAVERMLDAEVRAQVSKAAKARMPENGARRAAKKILDVALPRVFPETEFAHVVWDGKTA